VGMARIVAMIAWREALLIGAGMLSAIGVWAGQGAAAKTPTFYDDVLPVMQRHCQVCHRAGGIAPMAFENYEETRRYAGAIRESTQTKRMPPWFAEEGIGKFSNDPSLNAEEIAILAAWAKANAPAGNPADATVKKWAEQWSIAEPEMIFSMAEPVKIPA